MLTHINTALRSVPRLYWAMFGLITLFFLVLPDVDLVLHRPFYDAVTQSFPGQQSWLFEGLAEAVEVVVVLVALLPLPILLWNLFKRQHRWGLTGRVYAYLVLSMALGPGLVVNELFKNHWGRARPRQIEEFGGTAHYTPPWLPTDQCDRNCSFTSGDASVGFWLVTVALLLPEPWRTRGIWLSIGAGLFVGYARMAKGAHFFSDVLYSGLFVFLVAWVLHRGMFGTVQADNKKPG